ncbi:Two component regulator three Y domain-containing protein [Arenibacter sp. GZD96]|uniref:helix-turn-helix and ligand-binding sensor domain-containing protein n=1 Tax=Aurantibrevibacter litoralis TaxID=3106030 RepID=UPI002AFEFF72|nr:hypothetical protein [Arenibacter sp. GZD-96]MEA1785236.1 Two component regulator three Y domain-containing protein [Arenibacter sp. GZD-96]
MPGLLYFVIRYIPYSIWLLPLCLMAQHMVPPIHNYKVFDYNAASQNWGLATDDSGGLFVANNKGLLYYNGEQWQLYKLPNNTIIRSVAYVDGKIYTGSYEEFGFWTKNEVGMLVYTSLTHLIDNNVFSSEEFWEIIAYKDQIIFRSFFKIYIYQHDTIKVVQPNVVIMDMTLYKDKILVASDSNGLFWLEGNTLKLWKDDDFFTDNIIVDLAVLADNELLIGTKQNGCYLLRNNLLIPWDETVNRELKLHQLNKILYVTSGKIAFGTIKNGIYLYNITTKTIERLNRETGLQNNTVLSLVQFQDDLWVGLDNGIDRVQLHTPISFFTDYSGILGTVYDIATYKDQLYLGSNTGVYTFLDDKLEFIEGSQGHVWDLEVLEGDLLVGHNTGTYRVSQDSFHKITSYAGGYQFIKVPEERNVFLQGTYNGITKYHRNSNRLWEITRVAGLDFPVKQFCFENNEVLWVAHPYKGLYRIKINSDFDAIVEMKEFTTEEIPNNYNIKLYNIKNQIIIQSDGKWYKYDPILDKIAPFIEFNPYQNKELLRTDDGHFWFIDNETSDELVYTDLKQDSLVILLSTQMRKRLSPEAENLIKLNDSLYFFTLGDGFGKINLNIFKRYLRDVRLPSPSLEYFKDEHNRYSLQSTIFKIPHKEAQDITIQMAVPGLLRPGYYYQLSGAKEQSAIVYSGTLNFQNLPFGTYELRVATLGINNETSQPYVLQFEIAPPWYLTKPSLMLYGLLGIGVLLSIRRYNRLKLNRKHNELKRQMEREQKEHLMKLEKEKMAKEVRSKQKELTSTAMNVAKKNELIQELKGMLLVNKEKFSNQQRYRSFIKKLDHSINDDEDWRNFEINFKELHEDFFEKLLATYKELTPKDLKLCAYLKMNLTSKEIGPLLGITTRGVEIHRYRLRKKLGLDSNENITNFMISFK